MKSFREYLIESPLTPEQYKKDADVARSYFLKNMIQIFPFENFVFECKYDKIMSDSMLITFANISEEKNNSNTLAWVNAKIKAKFEMDFTDENGDLKPSNIFKIEMIQGNFRKAKVNYKTIKGKSPLDAIKKLVLWFKKNEKKIKDVTL